MSDAPENRAAWLTASKANPLEIKPSPYPTPGPGQLVVENAALGINSVDWAKQMLGEVLLPYIPYPIVLGTDVAGTVVAVGPPSSSSSSSAVGPRFRQGDRVIAVAASITSCDPAEGGFQLYTLARQWLAAPLPDSIDFTHASVLPMALLTASVGLFDPNYLALHLPSVPPRETTDARPVVIVTGAASAVGSSAVQLAVSAGYDVVATASPKNFEYAKKLGSAHVFDYKSPTVGSDIGAVVEGLRLAGGFAIGDGSADLLAGVLSKHEGPATNKFVALAGGNNGGAAADAGVEVKFILLGPDTISADSIVRRVFEDYLPSALRDGQFVPAPEPEVVGKGLEKIQDAFMVHMQGVSAKKIVVEL